MTTIMGEAEHRVHWRDRPRNLSSVWPWLREVWLRFWTGPRQIITPLPPEVALRCSACPAEVTPDVVDFAGRCVTCSDAWADMEFAELVRIELARVDVTVILAELRAEDEPPAPVVVATPTPVREFVLRRAANARNAKAVRRQLAQLVLAGTDAGLLQDALCVFVEQERRELAEAEMAVAA